MYLIHSRSKLKISPKTYRDPLSQLKRTFCLFYGPRLLCQSQHVSKINASPAFSTKTDSDKHSFSKSEAISLFTTVGLDGKVIASRNHPLAEHPGFVPDDVYKKLYNPNSVANKLKLLVAQYGSIAITFHVALSLSWLGVTYTLVYYGLDLASWVAFIGLASEGLQAKLAGGASTFVVAYSIHKCFALVRLSITATCVPLLVRYLRKVGVMKQPLKSNFDSNTI